MRTTEPDHLDIIVVGAGLSGLAASIQCALSGHNVTVLESAKGLAEIGAGLQLTPNATRLLQKWGVYEHLDSCEPSTCTVYNYRGKVLAHEDGFGENMRRKYGSPFSDCHRVDLQQGLVKRAMEVGVRLVLGARVGAIDFDVEDEEEKEEEDDDATPAADEMQRKVTVTTTTANGKTTTYTADLVIGADGLWSTCRSILLGRRDPPLPTGDLAFRIVLDIEQISDPELKTMVTEPGVRFWAGPGSHAVAYSVRGGTMYNVVLLVPDDLPEDVARTEGNVEEMRMLFAGWDPVLTRLLDCVDKVDKWKLMHRAPLPSWINPSSNLVLIGDACHPMLPYLAQGANSSIEDGAVLGLFLSPSTPSNFQSRKQLPETLLLFQKLRKSRGEAIARETFKQRHDFHLVDGEEQEERDRVFGKWLGKEAREMRGAFPSRWTCPEVQPWLYGYDAEKEVEEVLGGSRELKN